MSKSDIAQLAPQDTEADAVVWLISNIKAFAPGGRVATEVPSHGRARTDLVVVTPRQLIGVEVKLRDWRRALGQAILNRYCFDLSYVALLPSAIRTELLDTAREFRVGVLAVSADCVEVRLRAARNAPEPGIRGRLRKTVEDAAQ